MMYAECEGICPLATSNLVRVQVLLGKRVGRDVFLYSFTLQPELDTPQRLQEYAVMHGVKPGWLFLTGARADIERLRYRLGFFDPNPVVDGDKATHTGMVRIGNDGYDRWTSASALALPEQIVATIHHVDRSRGPHGRQLQGMRRRGGSGSGAACWSRGIRAGHAARPHWSYAPRPPRARRNVDCRRDSYGTPAHRRA
jgi:hypothetical protein